MNTNNQPYPIEKIISIASYLTAGFVGFLYVIFAIVSKFTLRPFVKYHVYQSIFLSILCFVVMKFLELILPVLNLIPGIDFLVRTLVYFSCLNIVFFNFSVFHAVIFLVMLYLCIGVAMNKYSYIPWVSNVIKYHI